jgi:EAL domain-containing protein (putative c-di-GMP-specific phosphodiesterase class I)
MDTVGRLGGDEFLVMLPVTDAEAAAHVAQKLLDQISQPFAVEAHDLMVTPSIGIAMFPRDGASFDELLKTADTAMYRSKDEGRNTYRFFTPEMNEAVSQRLVLENSLRRAIEAKEFVLFFQPQYDIGARSLIGAEALIRWREPTLGFVSPGQFIPIAEESNLIEAIGAWVLDEACRQIRSWIDQGYPMLRVSVNFSARQFAARGVVENFDRVLARHGLSGAALEVEITESLLAGDMEYTLGVLTALRARGVHVAVDDFGTGYSSLSYLKRFPVNRLKIDQSFVRDIESDADDRAIATAVVTLGHSLGMQVIAEGVEGETQLEILAAMGCDEVQGFHLGRPMSAEQFTALLEKAA